MQTVEAASAGPRTASLRARGWTWAALSLILALALALRLWGIAQGLPYVYNSDENAHFVPRAIGMFGHTLNPQYFANPPAFTYLLHLLFGVWFGGGRAAAHAYAAHPTEVFVLARASAAVLGTLAVWLLYLVGRRLFDRRVALLAAALEAVAFLPVFYSHLALNDVPMLAPLTLSLLGCAGVLRRGAALDYVLAGVGLGLACATKYTAGIALICLLAAAASQYLQPRADAGRRAVAGLLYALICALAAFLAANPYALLDFQALHAGIAHQSSLSSEAEGKLGAPQESGLHYYLWSFTWGLGWVPSLAAAAGAVTIWFRERRVAWMLVATVLAYLAFMGFQSRYFGRWLLPIFPLVCLLAAFFALEAAAALARLAARGSARRARVLSTALPCLAVAALCWQGLLYSVHVGLVLSRAHTANLTRAWMVQHIPAGARIVLEPVVPDNWVADVARVTPGSPTGARWVKYHTLRSEILPSGQLDPAQSKLVKIEDYERTLSPALIGYYEAEGFCYVITGSTQYGRALSDPHALANALAYYRALSREGQVLYRVSPYEPASQPVAFNFDWTFDYYPLAYRRPGGEMAVYHLTGGACRPRAARPTPGARSPRR
ncbi:MAG TPA: glycosyltransferase family 39 protein [Solirubrobacteraceae bacterium]|jgi:4-amino-4-deoxy-L-arabinose transferase-like glycosyltransferase